jgi:hypothetical protein
MAAYNSDWLKDPELRMIVTFDGDGIPRTVVTRDADGKETVNRVDQELIDRPIPRATFRNGPLEGIDLLKTEAFELLVHRPRPVGSNGSTAVSIHVRSQLYPR